MFQGEIKNQNKKIAFLFLVLSIGFFTLSLFSKDISNSIFHNFSDDFTYEVSIFSTDNFYNEEAGEFSGEFISDTDFLYRVIDEIDNVLIVENIFDVRTFEGEKIFSVERLYGVDPVTGKHVPGFGDKERNGFLFAPRDLKEGQNFNYWHINYDEPAPMIFQNKENIHGLEVYRYETRYTADQTVDLGHLPGVSEEFGIILDIKLTAWFEPVTGYLANYEDDTTAYYYDINTGTRLYPWNKFSNTYNRFDIVNTINEIELHKENIEHKRGLIKIVLLIFAICSLIVSVLSLKFKINLEVLVGVVSFFVGLGFMLGWLFNPEMIRQLLVNGVSLKFITSLSFCMSGALLILISGHKNRIIKDMKTRYFDVLAISAISMSLFLIMVSMWISTVSSINTGLEELFVLETVDLVDNTDPILPSLGTLLAFLFIAIISIASIIDFKKHRKSIKYIAFTISTLGLLAIIGHILGNDILYYKSMSIYTATLFLLIGLAFVSISIENGDKSITKENHEY